MTAHVIYDHGPARKRRVRAALSARAGRQLVAILVTLAALLFATWLGPRLRRPAPEPEPVFTAPAPSVPAPQMAAPAAEPAPLARRRARPAPPASGIPLDGQGTIEADGYDVLSAQELDLISQARDDGRAVCRGAPSCYHPDRLRDGR